MAIANDVWAVFLGESEADPRRFQGLPNSHAPRCLAMSRDVSRCLAVSRGVSRCLAVSRDVPEPVR